jgi:hypothetical protein
MAKQPKNAEKDRQILAAFFPEKSKPKRKNFKRFPCPGFADGLDEFADALEREEEGNP